MPTNPELQARIDALEDPMLRARIMNSLELNHDRPKAHRVPDEGLFEVIVTGYQMATEQQARMRKWQESEIIAFIDHVRTQAPDLYAKYLDHERDLRDKAARGADEDELWFDADIRLDFKKMAYKWMSYSDAIDASELVIGAFAYARTHLV